MEAGINNIIYMELHSGPKMVNGTCGKMIIAGMTDRDSTVYRIVEKYHITSSVLDHNKTQKLASLSLSFFFIMHSLHYVVT